MLDRLVECHRAPLGPRHLEPRAQPLALRPDVPFEQTLLHRVPGTAHPLPTGLCRPGNSRRVTGLTSRGGTRSGNRERLDREPHIATLANKRQALAQDGPRPPEVLLDHCQDGKAAERERYVERISTLTGYRKRFLLQRPCPGVVARVHRHRADAVERVAHSPAVAVLL